MFSNFEEETRNIIVNAKAEMKKLKHPYVGSEHLLLAILKGNNNVSKKLKQYNLTYDGFKKELINVIGTGTNENDLFLYTPLLKRILETAVISAKEDNSSVTVEHLFSSLLEEGEGIAIRILIGMKIDLEQLDIEFMYQPKIKKTTNKLLIDELGVDITKKAKNNELDPVIGREKEITRIIEILSRRCKNNPILVGEAGVGKTALVEELSRRIVTNNVPLKLKNKRVISLDMASLVAGTKYRGEFEDKIKKVLKEIEENDDIILFIDEIHTLVGAGGAEGAIDASNILKPALARSKLKCIGATTINEYKQFIEKDHALDRRFQKVIVDVPSIEEVRNILNNVKSIYEGYHYVKINDEIIDLIIDLSEKYIYDRNQPDKALDILDEVCARVSIKEDKNQKKYNKLKLQYNEIISKKKESIRNNDFDQALVYKDKENIIVDEINSLELNLYKKDYKIVTKEDVANVISLKTKIPIYELLSDNKKVIKNIEKELKEKIIGQPVAINSVLQHLKKVKLGYHDNKCYSMLFVGPTGVGKTMLAKTFGSLLTKKVIKLDMSEYAEAHSISKIIGSPPGYVGYDNYNNILEEIRTNPYSVLILDEIERAHPNIINLFFNVLDEGIIKDSKGRIVRFDNVNIIMTSNIGFDDIHVGFINQNNEEINSKLKDYFETPFLNRIDNVVIFNKLTEKDIQKLITDKINKLITKYDKYNLTLNSKIINEIKEESNYKEYGARKIDKIIKDKLLNKIIDNIINKEENIVIDTIMTKI